jgi:hypothetical protein
MDDPTRKQLKRLFYQAAKNARERGLTGYPERFYKMLDAMLDALDDGKEIEGLEEIRPVMKELLGYDPLEGDTRLKGEKRSGLARSGTRQTPSLQDLRRRIYTKAKAESAHRFWGLYVHVSKMETLREAYKLAKENDGAPGIDGVTFEAIEEGGVEAFLAGIRDELASRKYRPMRNRVKETPKGDGRVRTLGIPAATAGSCIERGRASTPKRCYLRTGRSSHAPTRGGCGARSKRGSPGSTGSARRRRESPFGAAGSGLSRASPPRPTPSANGSVALSSFSRSAAFSRSMGAMRRHSDGASRSRSTVAAAGARAGGLGSPSRGSAGCSSGSGRRA